MNRDSAMSGNDRLVGTKSAEGFGVSVIVTFHNEGRIAFRTLKALQRAVKAAESRCMRIETVIVLDSLIDKITRDIVLAWKEQSACVCKVLEVTFRCPARSRNYGIQASIGEFIAIHDGDDLFGENWLSRAYAVCSTQKDAIAHPDLTLFFAAKDLVWCYLNRPDDRALLERNLWPVAAMADKAVFQRVPYESNEAGFGYEDYLWNCKTTALGYKHVIVPETVAAVRVKQTEDSHLQREIRERLVVRPNALFRRILCEPFAGLEEQAEELVANSPPVSTAEPGVHVSGASRIPGPSLMKTFGPRCLSKESLGYLTGSNSDHPVSVAKSATHDTAVLEHEMFRCWKSDRDDNGNGRDLSGYISGMADARIIAENAAKNGFRLAEAFPWAHEALLKLARIDPQICPNRVAFHYRLSRLHRYITKEMKELIETKNSRLYLMPFLIKGGAELAALNYMNAVQDRVFVITTSASQNTWKSMLPKGAVHIDLGNSGLTQSEMATLLVRLILEADIEFIHTINCRPAFELFINHPRVFAKRKMFLSLYGPGLSPTGYYRGFMASHFPYLLDHFHRIATDCFFSKRKIVDFFGLDDHLTVVHPSPFSSPHFQMEHSDRKGQKQGEPQGKKRSLNLLFAGRICRTKRIHLAVEALQRLNRRGFNAKLDIWGYPYDMSEEQLHTMVQLGGACAEFRGSYTGLASLDLTKYDALLLTSESEGLPNVLIECAGNGIPAIAANVGGVPEIVTQETGWLVDDHDNPEAYVRAIESLLENPGLVRAKGDLARRIVRAERTWSKFCKMTTEFYEM